MVYDVVVIGAGPAGLGAVHVLKDYPELRVLVIDAGLDPDKRAKVINDPRNTAVGAGGAALINDGKFTFGLAGTKFRLMAGAAEAAEEVARLIRVTKEELEANAPTQEFPDGGKDELRRSLSVQRPRAEREDLVRKMIDSASDNTAFLWETKVTRVAVSGKHVCVNVKNGSIENTIVADSCVFATGRLAATTLFMTDVPATNGRLEIGVRISAPNTDRLFQKWGWSETVRDPKLILQRFFGRKKIKIPIEIRSFCFCRNGEVVESRFDTLDQHNLRVWSGVSDTDPTGNTNVGINVRILDANMAKAMGLPDTRTAGVTHVNNLTNIFDINHKSPPANEWEELLQFAVNEFEAEVLKIQKWPENKENMTHGPYEIYSFAVEGVQSYFKHDPTTGFMDIKSGALIAVAGDCTGEYRGLVPAMGGGIVVARQLVKRLQRRKELPYLVAAGKICPTFMAESHIFVGPLNPSPEEIARYKEAVEDFNTTHKPEKPMKAPVLSLLFRGAGYVTVLQSARYSNVKNEAEALAELHRDAAFWQARGYKVLREKLELSVHGSISGLPHTEADAIEFGQGGWYYESHIKVKCNSAADNDPKSLAPLCEKLTKESGWPVVLSYSHTEQFDAETGASLGVPRFLNLRMRSVTVEEFLARVKATTQAINDANVPWKVEKSIDEAVIFDSWPGMDDGWINWSKSQLVPVCGARFSGKSTLCAQLSAKLRQQGILCTTLKLSTYIKEKYIRQNNLPANIFDTREGKETHRAGLIKLLDEAMAEDKLFAARRIASDAEQWAKKHRGVIFIEDTRYDFDVDFLASKDTVPSFDVLPILLCPSDQVRVDRGWVPNDTDTHSSEVDIKSADRARFALVDETGQSDLVDKVFDLLMQAHR